MTSTSDSAGIVVDVEALRHAAALLRTSASPLGEVLSGGGESVGAARDACGVPLLATALDDFARRWADGVEVVAGRVDGYAVMLRATVDAHAADDTAAAVALGATPAPR